MTSIMSAKQLGTLIAAKVENLPVDVTNVAYYSELLTLIGEYELASIEENIMMDIKLYIFYMGLHIIVNDINGAKHLWRRSPAYVKSNNAYTQLKNICLALLKNDMNSVNQILISTSWSESNFMNCNIIETSILFLRARLWKIIHKSYKIITLNNLAEFVMLNIDETKIQCNKYGWTIDENNMVTPTVNTDVDPINIAEDQIVLIKTLSTYISHLERKPLKIDITKAKDKKTDTVDGSS